MTHISSRRAAAPPAVQISHRAHAHNVHVQYYSYAYKRYVRGYDRMYVVQTYVCMRGPPRRAARSSYVAYYDTRHEGP